MRYLLLAISMLVTPLASAQVWETSQHDELPLEDNNLNVGPGDGELFDLDTQWDYVDRLNQHIENQLGESLADLFMPIADKAKPKMNVVIEIDRGAGQFMNVFVYENDVMKKKYEHWPVSTGLPGRGITPKGTFRPFEMNAKYFSRKFKVILPYGIKFQGGNLIHAASKGGMFYLGKRRSHGCVRLNPVHAKILYGLVREAGMKNTKVVVLDKIERKKPAAADKSKESDQTKSDAKKKVKKSNKAQNA